MMICQRTIANHVDHELLELLTKSLCAVFENFLKIIEKV